MKTQLGKPIVFSNFDENSELPRITKREYPESEFGKSFKYSLLPENIIDGLAKNLAAKLDETILFGLKLFGFEFRNKLGACEFIKHRCTSYENMNETFLCVDKKPFMKFIRADSPGINITKGLNSFEFSADYGHFEFL